MQINYKSTGPLTEECALTIRHDSVFLDSAVRYIYYYLYDRIQLSQDNVKDGAAFVIIPFPSKWSSGVTTYFR